MRSSPKVCRRKRREGSPISSEERGRGKAREREGS